MAGGVVAGLESVPLEAVPLAAFQVLLWRHGAGDDLVVGVRGGSAPVARGRLAMGQSFADVVRQAGRALADGASHPVELAELASALGGEASGTHPLFQAVVDLRGIRGESLAPVTGSVGLDIALALTSQRGEWTATLAGSADLFESATVERMLRGWACLLHAALADPSTPIDRLPLASPDEMRDVRATWEATARRFDGAGCLHERIAATCRARPDATAVVGSDLTLTFDELDRRADALARVLASRGVGPDVRVGLCLERSAAQVVAIYAILKAGGAYVPLDPQYPAERLAFMLRDAGVALIVTRGALSSGLGDVATIDVDAPLPAAAALPTVTHDPEQLAYVIYTSGSTGTPKGAAVPHRAALNLSLATMERLRWTADDRALQFSTVNFDFAVEEIFCSLIAGGILLLRTDAMVGSMRAFLAQCDAWGVTLLNLPTAFWHEVAAAVAVDGLELPRSVRALVAGGERMLPERAAGLRRALGESVRLWNGYGPTEVTVFTTLHDVTGTAEEIAARPVPIGRPLPNVRAYVLDAHREPTPFGVPGELYVGGAGVARGYLARPELTAERFLPDPFAAQAGALMYATGDRVRLRPSGELEYLGRFDDQVKIRGFRVELGEVEHALRGHPGVRDCAVIAREDVAGDRRLVAYVVAAEAEVHAALLRGYLLERLPAFMVPAAIVLLPALPVNANGKVDRRALPAPDYRAAARAAVVPATALERTLLAVFAEVLDRPELGVTDDFFEAGGHSLHAMRALGRVAAVTGAALPLRALFDAPTVRQLAERVERSSVAAASADPVAALPARGATQAPLTPAQELLWMLQRTVPGLAAYNIPAAWRIEGALDPAALRQALDALLVRHAALRSVVTVAPDGTPWQRALPTATMPFDEDDLRSHPQPERGARLQELMARTAGASFDLAAAVPARARLVRTGDAEHYLLLTVHHIASDGWSQALLVSELSALYAAARGGPQAPDLPPATFADYALWQRDRIAGARLEQLLAYWRGELAGMPDLLELPLARPRPAAPSFDGGRELRWLRAPLVAKLGRLAREQDATLYMVLLAAFQTLLHRYGGQRDLVVGSPAAGRVAPDVERTIGFFSVVILQRSSFADDPTFRTLLDRVRERAIAGLEQQEAPLELIQADRHPGSAAKPLLQAVLALHNTDEAALTLDGVTVEPIDLGNGQAKFEIELALSQRGGELVAALEYRRELFDRSTMTRLLEDFESVLESVAAMPDRPVSALPLVAPGQSSVSLAAPQARVPSPSPRRSGRQPNGWLEEELVAVWEEVLGVSPIAVDDDFFELGGHSLLAARMLTRVGDRIGRDIPLATVLAHPTVAHLARALVENPTLELVVPLRRGEQKPFFWFHSDFDGGLYSPALVRHIDRRVPVFAVAPHPPGGPGSIEAMAADHAAAIRARQPEGPYRLGGFCFGGLVAFAAAAELRRAGEAVDVLVLVDAYGENSRLVAVHDLVWRAGRAFGASPARIEAWWQRHHDRLARFARGAPQPRHDAPAAVRALGLVRLGWSAVRHALAAFGRRAGLLPAPKKRSVTVEQAARAARRLGYQAAIRAFMPQPYDGPLTLVWSEEHFAKLTEPSGGWNAVSQPRVRVLPGDHDAMVGDSLAHLGAVLTEDLRAAEEHRAAGDGA
jgi:amino acid adenylation domain-containing protein